MPKAEDLSEEDIAFANSVFDLEKVAYAVVYEHASETAREEIDLERTAYVIVSYLMLNSRVYFNGVADRHALDRYWSALCTLSDPEFSDALSEALHFSLMNDIHERVADDPDKDLKDEFDSDPALNFHRLSWDCAELLRPHLLKMYDLVEKEPPVGKKNYHAIDAVEGARVAWSHMWNKEAPKSGLNPATPFGRFLTDLLEALGIAADPRSAFNAWAKEHKRHLSSS